MPRPSRPPLSTPSGLLAAAGWLAAAVIAALVGVGALRLVGESIAGTPGGVLSQQEVDQRLARATAATPSPSGSAVSPSGSAVSPSGSAVSPSGSAVSPSASAPGPGASAPSSRKVFTARGGSVIAECDGTSARLVNWSPAQGFGTHEVEPGPAAEAEVDFRGSAGRSKIEVHCAGGQPVAEYDDDDGDNSGED